MKHRVVIVAILSIMVSAHLSGCTDNDSKANAVAVLNTSKGIIKIELYEDKTPKTAENFIKLSEDGFYNGLIFHRIKDNFR